MTRHHVTHLTLICLALTGGCIPEKKIAWAPDGEKAALSTSNGLVFFDATGKMLPAHLDNTTARPAWFPDGRRLLIAYSTKVAGWNEISHIFTPDQLNQIESDAKSAKQRVIAYQGDWDKFKLDTDESHSPGHEAAVLFYLRDKLSDGLPEKLGEHWPELQKAEATIWQLRLFDYNAEKLTPGKVLLRSLDEMWMPSVSPTEKCAAYLAKCNKASDDTVGLFVISTSGQDPQLIHANVALGFDWRPDGRSLAYLCGPADGNNDKSVMLGSISTIEVVGADGELLKEFNKQEDHVGILFSQYFGVRWMKGDRLMFSSVEFSLPATNRDMPQRWSLFVLDLNMPASVMRALPRDFNEQVELTSALFQPAPDERRVLIPGSKGRVYLFDFISGETRTIQTEDLTDHAQTLPAWRNNDELTFVRPVKSTDGKDGGELVHWKNGTTDVIGKDWPATLKEGWLTPQ